MIYTAKELINSGETEYSIRNKISNGKLFLLERGIYSDEKNPFLDEEYICKKYPKAILTGPSAFFFYGLTDFYPDCFYLSTEQHSFPIKRSDVFQSYQDSLLFNVGKTTINNVNIYDLERTLIELIRLKEKYPSELYYEVLNNFRKNKHKLDFYKVNEYAKKFKNGDSLLKKIKEII